MTGQADARKCKRMQDSLGSGELVCGASTRKLRGDQGSVSRMWTGWDEGWLAVSVREGLKLSENLVNCPTRNFAGAALRPAGG